MMQIGIAAACVAIAVIFAAKYPQFVVPTAIRDAAKFLGVDMHQLPGGGFLITDRCSNVRIKIYGCLLQSTPYESVVLRGLHTQLLARRQP